MKKVIYSLLLGAVALSMHSCMEVDNFDGPEARFFGTIYDSTTGKPVLADQGECYLKLWEKSWSLTPSSQDIPLKQDGTFQDTKLFNGTYDVVPEGSWWPADTVRVPIGRKTPGKDFTITPYLKIEDFSVRYVNEATKDSIFITAAISAPMEQMTNKAGELLTLPRITDVRPFISTVQFCGGGHNIGWYYDQSQSKTVPNGVPEDYGVQPKKLFSALPKDETGTKTTPYVFKVPVKHGYYYFIRVGARVDDMFKKYNYSEIAILDVPLTVEPETPTVPENPGDGE